jgi:hypothetical protein
MSLFLGLAPRKSADSGFAEIAIAVSTGLACIGLLPISSWLRLTIALAYAPLMAVAMFGYTFAFICVVFGDCL